MASTADAEAALAALIANALALMSVSVATVRGWPSPSALDAEMKAGRVVVSVYRLAMSRNTTRYLAQTTVPIIPAPTLTATVIGGIATFVGAAGVGQVAGVLSGGTAYATRTVAGDTPASVVGRIGIAMPAPVLIAGATITAPDLTDARTAADASAFAETGRQENTLQADLWCPTPPLRDQAEALAVPAISAAPFLPMPDGSAARTRISAVLASDDTVSLTIYRLMVRVTAEIAIGATEADPVVLWPGYTLQAGQLHTA